MLKFNRSFYVGFTDSKMIYKMVSVREIDSSQPALLFNFELVAGYDYIDPDMSDRQGYVSAENFNDDAQSKWYTVYLMQESLLDRIKEDDGFLIEQNDLPVIHVSTIMTAEIFEIKEEMEGLKNTLVKENDTLTNGEQYKICDAIAELNKALNEYMTS